MKKTPAQSILIAATICLVANLSPSISLAGIPQGLFVTPRPGTPAGDRYAACMQQAHSLFDRIKCQLLY